MLTCTTSPQKSLMLRQCHVLSCLALCRVISFHAMPSQVLPSSTSMAWPWPWAWTTGRQQRRCSSRQVERAGSLEEQVRGEGRREERRATWVEYWIVHRLKSVCVLQQHSGLSCNWGPW